MHNINFALVDLKIIRLSKSPVACDWKRSSVRLFGA